jgi:beta-galactosidase
MRFALARFISRRTCCAILIAAALFGRPGRQLSADEKVSAVPPTQLPGQPALLVGVAWYPEQWPESRWEQDLKLMEAAHVRAVRIAEFAWSALEPSEGHFEFGWLDRAVALAARHHIISIVGTPTAAPPAWLTSKYPETLRVEVNGIRAQHGGRAHGSPTSPKYREFCRRIAEEMAKHFGHNPNVVGWQIDNEYGYALMSYDEASRRQFQDWLKEKFKTTENLNAHWTTAYWSQTYDNWSEVPIPQQGANPGLMLEWKNFVTYTWTSYQQTQIAVIRANSDPRQFITGNFMGWFDGFDHYGITKPLTFVSWDDYVGTGHFDPDWNGLMHDLMRGLKRENFWIIETQPGNVNWTGLNNALNKGEVRARAWHAVAHGADYIGYWQWRSALNGQEQYHGVLVGQDGQPVPVYEEVSSIAKEFDRASDLLRGTRVDSEVALLHSYPSRWAIDWQKHNSRYDQGALLKSYYHALRKKTDSLDVISPDAPLEQYKLVAAPDLNLISEATAKHLLEYVRNGGHLVLGPRSGMKDEFNTLVERAQPGFLEEALGAHVEQYYALEKNVPLAGSWGTGESSLWAERLKPTAPDAEVLERFGASNGWLDDQAAAVSRKFGKGRCTYIGALLDEKTMAAAADWMAQQSQLTPPIASAPAGVEISRRAVRNRVVFVAVNSTGEAKTVELSHPVKLMFSQTESSRLELPAYGVEIVTPVEH